MCQNIRINQHHTADSQNGPKSAPFPCENANLTNGTSFVFLGNLKHDFSLKWMFLARFGLKCLILQFFFCPRWAKLCTASLRQRLFFGIQHTLGHWPMAKPVRLCFQLCMDQDEGKMLSRCSWTHSSFCSHAYRSARPLAWKGFLSIISLKVHLEGFVSWPWFERTTNIRLHVATMSECSGNHRIPLLHETGFPLMSSEATCFCSISEHQKYIMYPQNLADAVAFCIPF